MHPNTTVIRKDYAHDLEKHAYFLNKKAHIKPKNKTKCCFFKCTTSSTAVGLRVPVRPHLHLHHHALYVTQFKVFQMLFMSIYSQLWVWTKALVIS